jgi:alkanesulfonate monooxygenase SsuD/methylene tetrahydromethanopterin reductase-like flavin-dependent oxidoreductase (luciferase family)
MTATAPDATPPLRLSVFSVQDHYPSRPRSVQHLYQEILAHAEDAERLGYEIFFSAEHHFHEYGVVPNPAVMLAALSQRTTRLRLGPAISILTFHHPLTVAESYAMVDVLSGGRLVLGVGSGYLKHEFEGYRIDGAEKRERFDEGLAILREALTGRRFSFTGKYTRVDDVQLNVVPLQQPVPIYTAILKREGAYHVGRNQQNIICVPYASIDRLEEVAELVGDFRKGRAEAGLAPSADDSLWTFHTHVAESEAQCRREAEAAFNLYVETRLYAKRQTYDDILASGLGLFGSVDQVADKLVRLHDMGIRHVVTLQNFGLKAPDAVRRSMELMACEVLPRARERIAKKAAA